MPKKVATELEFLRWYYEHVDHALGPGSDDVNDALIDDFKEETGKRLPKEYRKYKYDDD